MMHAMKWALPICLLFCAISAGAQPNTIGYTTLEYDAQSNTMIGTCTISPDYYTQADYAHTKNAKSSTPPQIQLSHPGQASQFPHSKSHPLQGLLTWPGANMY